MKAVVAAFNQEKALVGAFSVITNLRMELFEALMEDGDLVTVRCSGVPFRENYHHTDMVKITIYMYGLPISCIALHFYHAQNF